MYLTNFITRSTRLKYRPKAKNIYSKTGYEHQKLQIISSYDKLLYPNKLAKNKPDPKTKKGKNCLLSPNQLILVHEYQKNCVFDTI